MLRLLLHSVVSSTFTWHVWSHLCASTPGRPAEDAWLGNISIDPSKGKGHAADPSSLRGRGDLFAIMQQKALQHNGSSNGLSDSSQSAAEADAWIGHRLVGAICEMLGHIRYHA